VILREYGGGMRRLEAVKSGEIKATALNEPLTSLARAQGVNVLIDLVPEQIAWVFSSIVVRQVDSRNKRSSGPGFRCAHPGYALRFSFTCKRAVRSHPELDEDRFLWEFPSESPCKGNARGNRNGRPCARRGRACSRGLWRVGQ
jgi:hypothetical protein